MKFSHHQCKSLPRVLCRRKGFCHHGSGIAMTSRMDKFRNGREVNLFLMIFPPGLYNEHFQMQGRVGWALPWTPMLPPPRSRDYWRPPLLSHTQSPYPPSFLMHFEISFTYACISHLNMLACILLWLEFNICLQFFKVKIYLWWEALTLHLPFTEFG